MSNINLNKAKKAKNDEFYTQLCDIEKEIAHYKDYFNGKWIYSNCDNYRFSNFKRYFVENFKELGLKRYSCICKDIGEGAYLYDYDGGTETITLLDGNGDFRSEDSIKLLKECDVVVTNPPFSLFREYVAQLMKYGKKFLIIGNMNAITYKEIFPYIKNNELWTGYKSFSGGMNFYVDEANYDATLEKQKSKIIDGHIVKNIMGCCWFTNLEHNKRNEELILYKKYSEDEYPKYDNYLGFNVNKVTDIPVDDFIDIEIPDEEYEKWKKVYGDDLVILE